MRRAAIVSPVRTPVGAFGGALRDVPVESLGSVVTKAVLERTGLDPAWIEDVTFAQSYANSETPCVGRWIALEAGLPVEVPGLQTDRRCGGGLQAIATAAMMVQTGACDVVLAGGVESMSRIEFYTTDMRWGRRSGTTQLYDRLDRGRERSQPVVRPGDHVRRRRPGHGGDLRKGVSVRAGTEVALEAIAWTQLVRPGDLVVWSQSSAEPLRLTASLLRSRESIGGFRAKWLACRIRQKCELFASDRLPSKPIETSSLPALRALRGSLQFSAARRLVRMPGPDVNVGGSALQRRRARRRQCTIADIRRWCGERVNSALKRRNRN